VGILSTYYKPLNNAIISYWGSVRKHSCC
jgi:hypothetical protein